MNETCPNPFPVIQSRSKAVAQGTGNPSHTPLWLPPASCALFKGISASCTSESSSRFRLLSQTLQKWQVANMSIGLEHSPGGWGWNLRASPSLSGKTPWKGSLHQGFLNSSMGTRQNCRRPRLWLKKPVPKLNPGKRNHGPKPA